METVIKIRNKVLSLISYTLNLFYECIMRKRLKNDSFTIICSNCIGGIIYHRLGKEFLSPTINLWMYQTDFLKFVQNLKGYLAKELIFIETDDDFPVAKLGDIKIFFNHYDSEQDAKESWNRRKQRIRYDNLFLIMYDRYGITESDIRKFGEVECRNKLVISYHDYPKNEYVKKMVPSRKRNGQQCMDVDVLGFRTFEKQFDYVKWLNN